jgi:hypothetical protein
LKDTNRENFLGHETVTFYIAIEEVEEIKNAAISALVIGLRHFFEFEPSWK